MWQMHLRQWKEGGRGTGQMAGTGEVVCGEVGAVFACGMHTTCLPSQMHRRVAAWLGLQPLAGVGGWAGDTARGVCNKP